jgi:hypothetical protein
MAHLTFLNFDRRIRKLFRRADMSISQAILN